MPAATPGTRQDKVNRAHPTAFKVKMGDTIAELIDQVNALTAANAVLVAKLNADAGVTDVNYVAVTQTTIKTLEQR